MQGCGSSAKPRISRGATLAPPSSRSTRCACRRFTGSGHTASSSTRTRIARRSRPAYPRRLRGRSSRPPALAGQPACQPRLKSERGRASPTHRRRESRAAPEGSGMSSSKNHLDRFPSAAAVEVDHEWLRVDLRDGRRLSVPVAWFDWLKGATTRSSRTSKSSRTARASGGTPSTKGCRCPACSGFPTAESPSVAQQGHDAPDPVHQP